MAAEPAERHEPKLDPKYDDYDFPLIGPAPLYGHPGYTTEMQEAQAVQLRMMLEQEGYKDGLDTLTMFRFLRARKWNVEAAKQMYVDYRKWRKDFNGGVNELTKYFVYTERAAMFEYYPQYYHKTDKDGRPLYIEGLGKIDLTKMSQLSSDIRMLSSLVVEYEKLADPRLPACSRKSGYLLETSCTIMDAKGVGLTGIGPIYTYLQKASKISQDYYPERLGKLYIINAPWGFSAAFSLVKKFLDPVTVAKIHIPGSGYQTELLAQVPAENLPKKFGGECECEGGCEFSDAGPWHDPQYAKPAKWEIEKQEELAAGVKKNGDPLPPPEEETKPVPTLDGTHEGETVPELSIPGNTATHQHA